MHRLDGFPSPDGHYLHGQSLKVNHMPISLFCCVFLSYVSVWNTFGVLHWNRGRSWSFLPYKHFTSQQALAGCRFRTFPCAGSLFVIPLCAFQTVPLEHVKFNFHLISVRNWSEIAHKKLLCYWLHPEHMGIALVIMAFTAPPAIIIKEKKHVIYFKGRHSFPNMSPNSKHL